ncbi:PPOX class F420-dependent oxidoreductase [Streptomyces violascens]|uniref:PPOX class F420-dependent oxidoreductase n=1 Tax=Streptomyces violascens TaxID=67381 RepID=UPI0037AC48CC
MTTPKKTSPNDTAAAATNGSVIPASHADLLTRPLFVHLATKGPNGTPHVNPVWQEWDGEFLRFTTTTTRRKCKNVTADPKVSLSVNDPDQPYRYLEVRGTVERIEPDPTGAFFDVLAKRYGLEYEAPVGDAEHRVVLVVRPERTTSQ